ncbi:septum site-determining protein MinC [Mastigocladopsis repens]|uniref:septum site-determining protein MinC n=1 Tax=Mastigocladopsis repens TaxID=221287 RepID=UPI00031BC6EA|nr:septum site-determining protein MinC [Mastigocladopsis repens]
MTSDSTIPDLESKKAFSDVEEISALSDIESISEAESNPILSEAEVNSFLLYLQSNSSRPDAELDSSHPDIESHPVVADIESNRLLPDIESNLALLDVEFTESPSIESTVNHNIQVQIKSQEGKLLLILPTESEVPASELSWTDIWHQMKLRLLACDRSFSPNTPVHLVAKDRLLDGRQLQELAETLNQFQIHLKSVSTSRRQTAIAAVTSGYSVEQLQQQTTLRTESKPDKPPLVEPLYLDKTLRSGEEIRHPGHVILLGDLNPGGIVVADGDILVWGRLRGIAHAGALGNRDCLIMALQMEPTQLRIADAVARAPEKSPMQFYPEVAYVAPQGIRITRVSDFSKILLSRMKQQT